MRLGAGDDDLREVITRAVWGKQFGHRINKPDFVQPARTMSCIGG